MKTMSVEHLFLKPITATIAGAEIEVKPIDAERGLMLFSNMSNADKKSEAIKDLVWLTIKESAIYSDLPETKEDLFKKMSLGSLVDWLNATIEANHLGDFVDKKKMTAQLQV